MTILALSTIAMAKKIPDILLRGVPPDVYELIVKTIVTIQTETGKRKISYCDAVTKLIRSTKKVIK